MKVRAKRMGYWNHIRRREGDVFTLEPVEGHKVVLDKDGRPTDKVVKYTFSVEEQFSDKWMEKVDKRTPEKVTGAKASLREESESLRALKNPNRTDADVI